MTVYTLGEKIEINRNYNGRIVFLRLPSVIALDKMSLPCRNFIYVNLLLINLCELIPVSLEISNLIYIKDKLLYIWGF